MSVWYFAFRFPNPLVAFIVIIVTMVTLVAFAVCWVYQRQSTVKAEQPYNIMLSAGEIDKIFRSNATEAENSLEDLKRELELLIASELSSEVSPKDVNSVPIQELQRTVSEVNKILSRINAEVGTDSQAMKLKADKLYEIAQVLSSVGNQYQEFYSKRLLDGIRYYAKWVEGLGKQYELRYIGETNNEKGSAITFEDIAKFFNLLTAFVEGFSETQPEEVVRLGEYAGWLAESRRELPIDVWLAQPKITREVFLNQLSLMERRPISEEQYVIYGEAKKRFIETALAEKQKAEIKETFMRLAKQWERETRHMSLLSDIVSHPAYQQIIDIGPEVIPLILEELRQEPNYWFSALRAITGDNPVKPEDRGRLQKMTQAWLEWGKQHGYKC